MEIEAQARATRKACQWIRGAQNRFWYRRDPKRFSTSLQELSDSDKNRDKLPAELVAAERTLPKAQAYHGYEFKIIDISKTAP